MSADHTHLQATLPDLTRPAATAMSPLARFVPMAATVTDQIVDQWVELELRRDRRRMRTGVAMLACLAIVAIPLIFLA